MASRDSRCQQTPKNHHKGMLCIPEREEPLVLQRLSYRGVLIADDETT